jgi:hypothetical protein
VREVAFAILDQTTALSENEFPTVFQNKDEKVHASIIRAQGMHLPIEKLLVLLGDSSEDVRMAVLETILQTYPETAPRIIAEVKALLMGKKSETFMEAAAQSTVIETIFHMEHVSSAIRSKLTEILDWPYWEVQVKAAQAFKMLRRNIPKEAIDRLLEIRVASPSQAVRDAADDALAVLLSFEMGIEEDQ